ncbi:MAG: chemotaxis protein CheC [Eubacteriales bacterium]|nr:chemotaxis protein CheC [Eubacteriales bacterium]MDD4390108.1 chemotaxis protein CheC [Eubacteriales bacterium]
MLNSYDELNEMQIDVLREIGNIGAGNAATSLAEMLDEMVQITVPVVKITGFDEAIKALGGAECMTVGVLVNFSGEANGMIMFLLNTKDAIRITDILVSQDGEEEGQLNDLKLSAIKEIGNILSASYINSISTLTGLSINLSIPYIAIDMAGALMSVPIIEFGSLGDSVMFIEEGFIGQKNDLKSHIIMFAEIDTLKIIMERLGL